MKLESSGTLKMFALYPALKDVLDHGGTLFIDELNARLHPLLVRNIILTFLSPEINTQNAQLIFTTHDVWQFSNELLRRDEIWLYACFGEMPTIIESYTCCSRFAEKFEKVTGQKYLKKDKDIYRKLIQYGDEEMAFQIARRCYKKCIVDGKKKTGQWTDS